MTWARLPSSCAMAARSAMYFFDVVDIGVGGVHRFADRLTNLDRGLLHGFRPVRSGGLERVVLNGIHPGVGAAKFSISFLPSGRLRRESPLSA